MDPRLYVLDENHIPLHQPDPDEWGRWYGPLRNRRVSYDFLGGSQPVAVSTAFLGQNMGSLEEPLFFCTFVLGGHWHNSQEFCMTFDQAMLLHAATVAKIRDRSPPLQDFTDG